MIKIIFSIFLMSSILFGIGIEHKVVFDLRTHDIKKVQFTLIANIRNLESEYKKTGDTLKVAVVISGSAYRFFIDDIKDTDFEDDWDIKEDKIKIKDDLEFLADDGVVFEVCGIGLDLLGIKEPWLYPYVVRGFSTTHSLINWQNKGYAYISIR